MSKRDLSQEELLELFEYDPLIGDLIWRVTLAPVAPVGSIAGTVDGGGYVQVRIRGKKYRANRIVWIMHNGAIPEGYVLDHENREILDNTIENLRLATSSQNQFNTGSRGGASKYKGVFRDNSGKKWRAKITANKVVRYLGTFDTELEASGAYQSAARVLHGDFYYGGD